MFKTQNAQMIHGDCVEELAKIDSDSIHYSIYSPPFASLYTYSASERDMGNCGKYIGIELKRNYYDQACANLESAEYAATQGNLFQATADSDSTSAAVA